MGNRINRKKKYTQYEIAQALGAGIVIFDKYVEKIKDTDKGAELTAKIDELRTILLDYGSNVLGILEGSVVVEKPDGTNFLK